jgi:chemotaxis protein methyltransferase CheR
VPRWDLPHRFDFIFCRNVMIYFDRATQDRMLQRFATAMNPGGLLFTGHAESHHHIRDELGLFQIAGKSVLRLTEKDSKP